MKLKRTNVPVAAVVPPRSCTACGGSGYYDDWNYAKNQPIPCDSCDGTGLHDAPTKTTDEN